MGNRSSDPARDDVVMKFVWSGIQDNPQYHANLLFLRLCKNHPHYSKYYTKSLHSPLKIDARTSLKFRVIIEVIGHLLVDFYNDPRQSKYIIGYIAMIHKDMELTRSDMFAFGTNLITHLTLAFHQSMSPQSQNIVSRYINNVVNEISDKIESLRKNEIIDSEFYNNPKKTLREQSTEKLMYGHTKIYWIERKREWRERLELWKRGTDTVDETEISSDSDHQDIPNVKIKSHLWRSTSFGSADDLIERYDITREQTKMIHYGDGRRRPTLVKNPGESQYRVVETIIDVLHTSNVKEIGQYSMTVDSIARQRRRQRHSIS